MAPSFQISAPWIEDVFVSAASFHPDTAEGNIRCREKEDENAPQRELDHLEPRIENIVPEAVTSSLEVNVGDRAANNENKDRLAVTKNATGPPPRMGKVVRVSRRGGDFRRCENDKRDDGSSSHCPPYLVLDDGKCSAVAFLSSEALSGLTSGNGDDGNVPSMEKSLVEISRYTISTILHCTSTNFAVHAKIIQELSRLAPSSPRQMRRRIDRQLFMCLYLQSPIAFLNSEEEGATTDVVPVEVHRSTSLRRALLDHQNKYPSDANAAHGINDDGEEERRSHSILIRRLEAWHCFLLLSAGDERGPQWPWESRLISSGDEEGCNTSRNTICHVKREGVGNSGWFATEDIANAAAMGDLAGGDADEKTAESPSSGGVDSRGPDIIEMVNALPDLISDRYGSTYTGEDLVLVDWIRENTAELRVLREKLNRAYSSKVSLKSEDDADGVRAAKWNTTAATGGEERGRIEIRREVSKSRRSERGGEAEIPSVRTRSRRSLPTTVMEKVSTKRQRRSQGTKEREMMGGSAGGEGERVYVGSNAGREGGTSRAETSRTDINLKGDNQR